MRRKKIIGEPRLLPVPENCASAVSEHLRSRFHFDRDATEVLDCGCGSGALDFLLAPYSRRITAIDPTPELVADFNEKISSSRIKNIRALTMDLSLAPRLLAGAQFDLIVSVMTLHHYENFSELLRTWKSLLKPDGAIAIIDLESEDGSFHPQNISVPNLGFAPNAITSLLNEIGFFAVVSFCPYVIKAKRGNPQIWREYPLFMTIADCAPPTLHR